MLRKNCLKFMKKSQGKFIKIIKFVLKFCFKKYFIKLIYNKLKLFKKIIYYYFDLYKITIIWNKILFVT